ncbi:MAG TPA: VOC family protein [Nevskiaceae bacterium]|nr:VOC family protein [Nevskiaceae bacterium]
MQTDTSLGLIRQLGYIVKDLPAAAAVWSEKLAVGPWTFIKNIPLTSEYEGKHSEPMIDVGLSYRGDMQIELIQQTNTDPSPFLPYIQRGQFGLHHTAFLIDRIDATVAGLQRSGLELECDIHMPGGSRYVFFRSPIPNERTFIELMEATPQIKQLYVDGIPAAAHWDGKTPPTVIDFAALGLK